MQNSNKCSNKHLIFTSSLLPKASTIAPIVCHFSPKTHCFGCHFESFIVAFIFCLPRHTVYIFHTALQKRRERRFLSDQDRVELHKTTLLREPSQQQKRGWKDKRRAFCFAAEPWPEMSRGGTDERRRFRLISIFISGGGERLCNKI